MIPRTPPQRLLVRLRQPLLVGGRLWPAGALLRLPSDLASTLWGRCRAYLLTPHPERPR